MHGTTVLCVRKDNKVVLVGDGQVTMGDHVMKHPPAHSQERALLMRLLTPKRLKDNEAFMWRLADQQLDEFLAAGHCEFIGAYAQPFAMLVVADSKSTFILSGNGDVIEPDDGIVAIGSGGSFALAAARAMLKHSKLTAKDLAMEAMRIASEICIYTNENFTVEEL